MKFTDSLRRLMCSAFACLGSGLVAFGAEQKPNIVFILVDDLGYGDLGFNGSTWYETPSLDKLAKGSLILDQAYMYPTCSPSRAALFTGKQSFRTGVYTVPVLERGDDQANIFSRWTVEKKHATYADPLKEVGYQGIHLGKWHIVGPYPMKELKMDFPLREKLTQPDPGDYTWVAAHKGKEIRPYYPEGRGFVKNVGGTFRGDPAFEEGGYKSETGGYRAPFSNPFVDPKDGDEWLTDRLTDDAIGFMKENAGKPFLVNLHYYTVHRPIVTRSDELFEKYMDKPGDPVTGQGVGKRREEMAGYATMLENLDQNIGRLVDFLDESGLRENTLIVFTSDNGHNGGQSSNHAIRESKGWIYEGGIRVPGLINWPGRVKARRSSIPVAGLDLFPTFLDVAGIEGYAGVLDGKSLTPLFDDDDPSLRERPLFWHVASCYKHGACSVIRKKQYKLIQWLKDGGLELYDLEKDPKEARNLAKENPEIAQRMLKQLLGWREANQVPLPPESPLPH